MHSGADPGGSPPGGQRAPGPVEGELGRSQTPHQQARDETAQPGACQPGQTGPTALPTHPGLSSGPACPLLPAGAAKQVLGRVARAPGRPGPQLSSPLQPGSWPAGRQLPGPGLLTALSFSRPAEEAQRQAETCPSHPAAGDEQNSEDCPPPPWPTRPTGPRRAPSSPGHLCSLCSAHRSTSVMRQTARLRLNPGLPCGPARVECTPGMCCNQRSKATGGGPLPPGPG